jgi:hypothetical protein
MRFSLPQVFMQYALEYTIDMQGAAPLLSSRRRLGDPLLEQLATSAVSFPVESLRSCFPALHHGPEFIFFDNAAGAQVPQVVFDAVNRHLLECNVQRGGRYAKSRQVDAIVAQARQSLPLA